MRALVSVTNKANLQQLAEGLSNRNVEIISTGGTARAIREFGVAVTEVSDYTGFPEMMDGRLKTLHPRIFGGILARPDPHPDAAQADSHYIPMIDIVVVNLYDFAAASRTPGVSFDDLVEQIDIGGPSLIRAAGKNWRRVTPVVDPTDYRQLLFEMLHPNGIPDYFRFQMMMKAFSHTANYDGLIHRTVSTYTIEDGVVSPAW